MLLLSHQHKGSGEGCPSGENGGIDQAEALPKLGKSKRALENASKAIVQQLLSKAFQRIYSTALLSSWVPVTHGRSLGCNSTARL